MVAAALLSACATAHRTYLPPDASHLKASTARVSTAVDKAHNAARAAQTAVNNAQKTETAVQAEVRKLKAVPETVFTGLDNLEKQLHEAHAEQDNLEQSLREADVAKAEVERDKTAYFEAAQKLADEATAERDKRIADENKLHWYRVHWYGAWILLGGGIIACAIFALVKTGIIAGLKL
jgi:chromosome segregation ATPase